MSTAVRWVVAAVAAVLVVCLLGWARGDEHRRGDEVGSLGATVTVVTTALPAAASGATHG